MHKMSMVGLLVRRNIKWILAFAVVFVYTGGVLANASGLSQWYSTKLTEEFLSFTNTDFAVGQMDRPEMAREVRGRIKALEEVRDVVSMMDLQLKFNIEFEPNCWTTGVWIYAANGTKILYSPLHLTSYLGLEERLGENESGDIPIPQPGMAVMFRHFAEELNLKPGGNLTMETPLGNVTFIVSGVMDLDHFAIWKKIENPEVPLSLPESEPKLVLVSWEDVVDLALAVGPEYPSPIASEGPEINIQHYVFCERGNLVEPANMDGSLMNFRQIKEKMELLTADIPVTFDSLLLTLFETTVPSVDLLSIIAYGYMLAALPLYWFVASTLISIFAKRKRREIALFRVKGMSARRISFTYITVVLISAGLGSLLGAVLQANVVSMLMEGYGGWIVSGDVGRFLGLVFPDLTSLIMLLVLGLILGIIALWRLVKSVVSLQPTEAVKHLPTRESAKPKRLSKLAMLLLALGLVKVGLVIGGLDSTVYFKKPPPNPYVAMALSLFAVFDTYALNALAPVFIAYGFANLASAKPELFSGLFKVLSYSAGLKRRKISFKIISSEMWRVSGSFLLVTLIVSYGVTSYVNYSSLTDHVWKMAGEFTGSDMRIDCTPDVTGQVEEAVKNLSQVLSYARIDVVRSMFTVYHFESGPWGSRRAQKHFYCAVMIIDPEQYNKTAYLDNAPELQSILTSLGNGSLIGLRELNDEAKFFKDVLVTEGYLPKENNALGKIVEIQEWLDLPLPGAFENPETINVSTSTRALLEAIYHPIRLDRFYEDTEKALFNCWYYGHISTLYLSYPLMRHTSDGPLWSTAGFVTLKETLSDTSYQHVKTHFIIKLKPKTDVEHLADSLRNSLTKNVMLITRADAANVITKSIPRLAISLAFAQMNCILITAISLGGVAAVTIVNAAGRSRVLSVLCTRGGRKLDGIALFLPEAVFVSLLAGVTGVLMGLLLAVSYTNSLADLVPSLLTKGTLQLFYGRNTWLFLCLTLTIFIFMHIITTAYQAKISKGVE